MREEVSDTVFKSTFQVHLIELQKESTENMQKLSEHKKLPEIKKKNFHKKQINLQIERFHRLTKTISLKSPTL